MNSEQSDQITENLDMNKKLMELSCPFTWEMEKAIERQKKLLEKKNDDRSGMVVDIQDSFPEFIFIYHLMLAHESVTNNDPESALQYMNKVEEIFDDIKQKGTLKLVENVLQHIFVATKCHVLKKLGKLTEEGSELLNGICDLKDMKKWQLAELSGCQCLAWSLYYMTDNELAISCANKAIKLDPFNGKWYFLLAKNHRRLRRSHQRLYEVATEQEISLFEKAYRLSRNALFGVTLARVYRESRDDKMATKIYKEVYALEPTSCAVQLQLAIGFIKEREPLLAKRCLEYVATKMPDSVIYQAYMGIYEEKCNRDLEAALPYYKSTTEKSNFGAEWLYIRCRKQVEPNWDPLPYMLGLLKKYEKDFDRIIQEINIQIGWYYLVEINDVLFACQYLTKTIEMQPDSIHLRDHVPVLGTYTRVNVYQTLKEELEFALANDADKYDADTIATLEDALELCNMNNEEH